MRLGQRGFTLIEVMMAASIFVVGVMATMAAFTTATKTFAHQRNTTTALHLTEAMVEDLVQRSPKDSDLSSGAHGPKSYDTYGLVTSSSGFFAVRWDVVINAPIARMRTVTVRTEWTEDGRTRSVVLSTVRN